MTAQDFSGNPGKIRLFQEKPRDYDKPSRRAETTYSFLDRSSLPEFERVRRMLERWVERLPHAHQRRTVANMSHKGLGSAPDQAQFNSAFFELFLHEFLLGTGGEVFVEPIVDGLTPDFKVTEELAGGDQLTYVVEATDIDLERGTELERDWNEMSVIDSLNEIISPRYYLYVRTHGKLETLPRKRHLKQPFEDLLEKADFEEALLISQDPNRGLEDLPGISFTHGGWTVVGHLIPVSPEFWGNTGPFVGVSDLKGGGIDDIGKTKDRLYEKARRYKSVDNLIVALRCDDSNRRLNEVLFGKQQVTVYVHSDPTDTGPLPEPQYSQRLDGFWCNSVGPQNQNVIGVVAFYRVHPGTLDRLRAIFYSNPYVNQPMPYWTKSITHAEYWGREINIIDGMPPCTFLRDYEVIGDPFGPDQAV